MLKHLKKLHTIRYKNADNGEDQYNSARNYIDEISKTVALSLIALYRENYTSDPKVGKILRTLSKADFPDCRNIIHAILDWSNNEENLRYQEIFDSINDFFYGETKNSFFKAKIVEISNFLDIDYKDKDNVSFFTFLDLLIKIDQKINSVPKQITEKSYQKLAEDIVSPVDLWMNEKPLLPDSFFYKYIDDQLNPIHPSSEKSFDWKPGFPIESDSVLLLINSSSAPLKKYVINCYPFITLHDNNLHYFNKIYDKKNIEYVCFSNKEVLLKDNKNFLQEMVKLLSPDKRTFKKILNPVVTQIGAQFIVEESQQLNLEAKSNKSSLSTPIFQKLKIDYEHQFSTITDSHILYGKSLDYFEEVLKRISLTLISIYRQNGMPDGKINRELLKLSRPSLGHWNHFITILLKWGRKSKNATNIKVFEKTGHCLKDKIKNPEMIEVYKNFMLDRLNKEVQVESIPFRALIDLIIQTRNWEAHEARGSKKWYKNASKRIIKAIDLWIDEKPLYQDYKIFVSENNRVSLRLESESSDVIEPHIEYSPFIICHENRLYCCNGNQRLRHVKYINHLDGVTSFDDDQLLKEQIAFFAKLKDMDIDASDIGSKVASSLEELEKVIDSYEGIKDGEIVGDDFRIIDEIGRGGMGIVYRAIQISRGRLCAVKLLPKSIIADETIFYRFKREADALEKFDHPNIVEYIDFGESQDDVYLAMEYIDGQGLNDVYKGLRLLDENDLPLQSDLRKIITGTKDLIPAFFDFEEDNVPYFNKIIDWLVSISDAVAYIHGKGIIHRDIKPANIMIEKETGRPVILDFGLAKTQDMSITIDGDFLGTMRFASPEQIQAIKHVVDERSDIYSLGVVLYELLTLRPIFIGNTIKKLSSQITITDPPAVRVINSEIPVEIETITHKCIEKSQIQRYQTASDLKEDLQRFQIHEPIKAKPPSNLKKMIKWGSRNPGKAMGISISFLFILLFIGYGWLKNIEIQRAYRKERLAKKDAMESAEMEKRAKKKEKKARIDVEKKYIESLINEGKSFDEKHKYLQAYSCYNKAFDKVQNNCIKYDYNLPFIMWDLRRRYCALPVKLNKTEEKFFNLRFSTDGKMIFSSNHESLAFWDTEQKKLNTKMDFEDGIRSFACHPKKEEISVQHDLDNEVSVWNFKGKKLKIIAANFSVYSRNTFEPDLFYTDNGKLIIYDGFKFIKYVDNNQQAFTLPDNDRIDFVEFSPDGKYAVTKNEDGILNLVNTNNSKNITIGEFFELSAASFSLDSKTFACVDDDDSVYIWSLDENKIIAKVNSTFINEKKVMLLDSGEELIEYGGKRVNSYWKDSPGSYKSLIGLTLQSEIIHVKPFDKSTIFKMILVCQDGSIYGFNKSDPNPTFKMVIINLSKVDFSSDGNRFATISKGIISLWETKQNKEDKIVDFSYGGYNKISRKHYFASHEFTYETSILKRFVKLQEFDSEKQIFKLSYNGDILDSIQLSLDGSLCMVQFDKIIQLWDLKSKELYTTLNEKSARSIIRTSFSPNSKFLAYSTYEKKLKLWDVESKNEELTLTGEGHFCFSPDNSNFVYQTKKEVVLYSLSAKKIVAKYNKKETENSTGASIAYSLNGKKLAFGESDYFQICDLQITKNCRVIETGNNGFIESLSFSPDGNLLAVSINAKGKLFVQIWDTNTDRIIADFKDGSAFFGFNGRYLFIEKEYMHILDLHAFENEKNFPKVDLSLKKN